MSATPAEPTPSRCPVCMVMALFVHCTSRTCDWHHCRNKPCDAVLDLRRKRGRGHVLDRGGDSPRRNVVLGGAA